MIGTGQPLSKTVTAMISKYENIKLNDLCIIQ